MTRDWKPGDVAVVEAGCWANRKVALRLAEGWAHVNGVNVDGDGVVRPVRPLVVIDPENFDAFAESALRHIESTLAVDEGDCELISEGIVAALQALIEPRPEEPTGLGAVAQSGGSGVLVRITPAGEPGQWLNAMLPDEVLPWDGISTPLVVLWEGVPS